MYYCKGCNKVFDSDSLGRKSICFETEYGVGHLFEDRHYHTVYYCPYCQSEEVEEAVECDICGEYFPEDHLKDTTEFVNGGCGYCCEQCIKDADMTEI